MTKQFKEKNKKKRKRERLIKAAILSFKRKIVTLKRYKMRKEGKGPSPKNRDKKLNSNQEWKHNKTRKQKCSMKRR